VTLPTNVLLMVLLDLSLVSAVTVMFYKRAFITASICCTFTVGGLLNTTVVLVNNNKMPVQKELWQPLGDRLIPIGEQIYVHITSTTQLWWLGDIFTIGPGMASIGDIIYATGACAAIIHLIYLLICIFIQRRSHNK